MKTRIALSVVVAAMVVAAVTHLGAQRPAPAGLIDAENALPLTCVQAWVESGKSYPKMLDIVKTLARVSLANRDLTFPSSREAGLDAGRGIADDCKADPDALLFAIVDKHVRRIAAPAHLRQ